MKIGIYGGTFNPIHRGHLTAARAALDALGLDRLLLIPASVPPHKALPQGSADAADRLEMAALACAELGPQAQALDTELHRTGPSYTVDTLRQLRMEHPEDELWLLMGTDMFLSLERWYHASDILSLAHIGAFDRAHPQPGRIWRPRSGCWRRNTGPLWPSLPTGRSSTCPPPRCGRPLPQAGAGIW